MIRMRKRTIDLRLAFTLALALAPLAAQTNPYSGALSLERQGKTNEAGEAWQSYSKDHPTDPVPFAHLGLIEARRQHYAEAIGLYRKAMALDPSMPGLRLNLGLAQFKADRFADAIESFLPILKTQGESSPQSLRLNLLIGMSYYGLGKYPDASRFLKPASDADQSNSTLALTLAHSCLLSRQYQCVLDAYHRLIAVNADSAEVDMLVGEALDEMKDYAGAIREFRAAIAANPREPNAHFGLGYLLWTQKQYTEAEHEFQAELGNTPDYTQAQLYLADTEVQLNKMSEARPILERLVKASPGIFLAHLDLGVIDSEAGMNEEALQELKAAQRLKPEDVNVHWRLGRLYRSMQKPSEATAEFNKAKSINKAADDALLDVLTSSPQAIAPTAPHASTPK